MATKTATTRKKRESYWERRTLERELSWHKKSQDTVEKELAAYYRQSLKVIEKDIEALYGTYMQDNKLSYRDAVRLLHGNDFRSWRMSMEDYITAIGTDKNSPLLRELNTLAMRSRISRLDRLHSETLMELDKLGRKSLSAMDKFLGKAYKDNYYRGLFDIGKAGEMLQAVSKVDAAKLEGILRTPWSGKNYSQRIWQNTDKLGKTIQDTIVAGLHRGDSPQKMVKLVSEKMGVGQSDAERLVRTELNYVQNQAALDSIQDAGMEFYQFCATLDTRTTPMCREHDGKIYPVEDAQPGENMPPLHPRCRSTIFASLEEKPTSRPGKRAARDRADRTIMVPADMTYKDWKAVFVDKTQTAEEWVKASGNVKNLYMDEKNVIISLRSGTALEQLEQARKKDHVFTITDSAIDKVPVVEVPTFSEEQNQALQAMHKEVLRTAKEDNGNKEVALITRSSFNQKPVKVLGTESKVDYMSHPDVRVLKADSYAQELILSHNHPTTKKFSFADVAMFVFDEYVGASSIVTNQGQVHILLKSENFDFDQAKLLLKELQDKYEIRKYPKDETRQRKAAREFLKQRRKVGVWYGKGK